MLFDLDGTLMLARGVGMRAMTRAGASLWGERFGFEGVRFAGGLDPDLFAAAATRCGIEICEENHSRFIAAYCEALPGELRTCEDLRVLPGVRELLSAMADHPAVTLGLLTGNYTRTAPLKLAAAGIDVELFAVRVFGDDAATRPGLVPIAMQRYEACFGRSIAARDVAVIGDTPKDIAAARAHRCLAVGVATGPYEVSTLEDAGADLALADLSDPGELWNAMGLDPR